MSSKIKMSFLFMMVIVLLFGLASSVSAAVTLKFMGHWSPGGAEHTAFLAAVEEYKKVNPDVTIEFIYEKTHTTDGIAKIMTLLAGDMMPDIIHTNNFHAFELKSRGVVAPPPPAIQNRIKQFFFPQILSAVSYQGTIYGMPTENQTTGMFFNKRMFAEAGLAPTGPKTWDEWSAQMKRLTKVTSDGTVEQWGAGIVEHIALYFTLLWSNGGTYMEGGKVGLNTSNALNAMQYMVNAVQSGWATNALNLANTATAIVPSYYVRNFQRVPDDWAAGNMMSAVPPAGPSGKAASYNYGWGLYVTKASPNQQAAWDFLQWWATQPNENRVTRAGELFMQLSLPSNPSDLQGRSYMLTDPAYAGFINAINYGKQIPMEYPGVADRNVIVRNYFQQALAGTISSAEALEKAQNEIELQIAEVSKAQ